MNQNKKELVYLMFFIIAAGVIIPLAIYADYRMKKAILRDAIIEAQAATQPKGGKP